jgi:CheY-like chemotaxis protein
MLEQLGYAVTTAGNAESALQAIEAGETFDLVLSDIVMAGAMDGIVLARLLKARRPELPILLATGYSRVADGMRGEFSILRKPYQVAELGRAISRLLAEARAQPGDGNLVRLQDARNSRAAKPEG